MTRSLFFKAKLLQANRFSFKRRGRSKKSRKKQRLDWSSLHEDLLTSIKQRLSGFDQLRFSSVCKTWRCVNCTTSAIYTLPWILGFRLKLSNKKSIPKLERSSLGLQVYNLYDPLTMQERVLRHDIKPGELEWYCIQIYASNQGWLFLSASPSGRGQGHFRLFLYHAFTSEIIDLPAMKLFSPKFSKGTFSTNPKCSSCAFYLVDAVDINDGEILLSTYRNGDIDWCTYRFASPVFNTLKDVVFMNQHFYCYFSLGLIWAFDIVSSDWREMEIDTSQITNLDDKEMKKPISLYKCKMVDSDGELLLVYHIKKWKPWYVFKLDWSESAWKKVVTLGNRAIFLGHTSKSVPISGKIKALAGRIYFHNSYRAYFYNFKQTYQDRFSKDQRCKYFKKMDYRHAMVWV